jgi:hypothetical protein
MSEGYFGIDNKSAMGNKFKKWEPTRGKKYYVAILCEDREKAFCGFETHFKEKKFRCKSTKDHKEVCCTHGYEGNTPKWSIGTVIVVYQLDESEGKKKLTGYEVTPWLFNSVVYRQIADAFEDHPDKLVDLKITVEDPKMMKFSINASTTSYWTQDPKLKARLLAEAKPQFDSLPKRLGSNLSVAEIADLLGLSDGTGASDSSSGMSLADLAGGLSD